MLPRFARPALQRVATCTPHQLRPSVMRVSAVHTTSHPVQPLSTSTGSSPSVAAPAAPPAEAPKRPDPRTMAEYGQLTEEELASLEYNQTQLEEPWLFGEDPSKPRRVGWWEFPLIGGMLLSGVVGFVCWTYGPNTSLHWWAREELLHTGYKPPEPRPDLED